MDHFKPVISTLRAVVAKFHRSHIGSAEFNSARVKLKMTSGLEAIGKTRFGTVIRAARALEKCLPVIKRVVEQGIFSLESYSKYFSPRPSQASASFQIALRHLIDIGSPALKAITCLEANEALPGAASRRGSQTLRHSESSAS
ncbi:hypothetical protein F5887DRAFT_151939 [Amanita rubescens]|nr:hypothetical protein F5887DRAFT_151939 [Amanita rubescens]